MTEQPTYESKINLPQAVFDVINPIFSHTDLGSDVLRSKCLHGLTQNPNESFNQCIWKKAPKETFVSRISLEVSVASAVLDFNDGGNGILNVIFMVIYIFLLFRSNCIILSMFPLIRLKIMEKVVFGSLPTLSLFSRIPICT